MRLYFPKNRFWTIPIRVFSDKKITSRKLLLVVSAFAVRWWYILDASIAGWRCNILGCSSIYLVHQWLLHKQNVILIRRVYWRLIAKGSKDMMNITRQVKIKVLSWLIETIHYQYRKKVPLNVGIKKRKKKSVVS